MFTRILINFWSGMLISMLVDMLSDTIGKSDEWDFWITLILIFVYIIIDPFRTVRTDDV